MSDALLTNKFLPLEIPTPDYNGQEVYKSVVHCDVLYEPEGWPAKDAGGTGRWKYWMAFTPYPDAARENPCVVCSEDGINWRVPPGAKNPVSPRSDCQADLGNQNAHHADTDIVILPNGQMALFYIAQFSDRTVLYRRVSTDGINWSPRKIVLDLTVTGGVGIMSPAVVVENDGTLTLFYGRKENPDVTANRLAWRTSSDDGQTWGSQTLCVYPQWSADGSNNMPAPWHLDVVKVDGVYHALVAMDGPASNGHYNVIWAATSTNKTNWTFAPSHESAIKQTGHSFDGNSATPHYRSSRIWVGGEYPRWDVYLCGIPNGHTTDGTFPSGNPWRIGLLKDLAMPQPVVPSGIVVPPASHVQFASAVAFWTANAVLVHRFTVTDKVKVRYACARVGGVSSGNVELGIFRLSGTNHFAAQRLATSGIFACPAINTNIRRDLGSDITLWPGDYGVYFWCDNVVATFFLGSNNAFPYASRAVFAFTQAAINPGVQALAEYYGFIEGYYTGWAMSGLSLEGVS